MPVGLSTHRNIQSVMDYKLAAPRKSVSAKPKKSTELQPSQITRLRSEY